LETLLHGIGFTLLLSLPTWGVDVDGLACPLHRPMAYNHQTRGLSFLPGAALSHRAVVGGATFPGGAKPRAWIFDGVLAVWVPMLLNLTWSKSFVPGHAYLMLDSSWHLCMYP
jgi:hypothetical protein